MHILFPLLCLLGIASSTSLHGPLTTDGRWIKDAHGDTVTFTGTNWPGHLEPMIPEGLQYQSYKDIIRKTKSIGMNAIRLTFAIEMVDEIFERNGTDVTLKETFIGALGAENGTKILGQVLRKNKDFTEKTTRLEVFGAIAKELARNGMYLHLDNHVSKAQWCCGDTDGNSWFGDVYFDVAKWQRGLAYLAAKADEWPSLMSIGMRNELRKENRDDVSLPYDFLDWYTHMTAAATAIHTANPNILIFFSGLNYSETVAPVPLGLPLLPDNPNSTVFRPTDFPWADKMVLEIHVYTMSDRINTSNCLEMKKALYKNGFNALDEMNPEVVYPMPVVMSEFGFTQNATMWQSTYAQCLKEFLPERKAGWMNWAVAGSYYTRSGTQDVDDSWGLLTHDWSEWRNEVVINEYYRPFVKQTQSGGERLCG